MPLYLLEEYTNRVNKDKQGKELDVNNKEGHTVEVVIGQILYKIMWYRMREYNDYLLQECF